MFQSNRKQIFLASDERMNNHKPPCQKKNHIHVERPERTKAVKKRLDEIDRELTHEYVRRVFSSTCNNELCHIEMPPSEYSIFENIKCTPASKEVILMAHSEDHYDKLESTRNLSKEKLIALGLEDSDLYYSKETFLAATLAVGGVLNSVDAVMSSDTIKRAVAAVRPPSHHACQDHGMGFCFFNSVAIAAKQAIATKKAERVLILDWDVHHGNGTQDLTYDDSNIFYMSLHRKAKLADSPDYFWPGTGSHRETGKGKSRGMNLNITWEKGGVGNAEYAAAFSELVLPLITAYAPDLILVSCGFDAAKGDLIGDCMLTTQFYYDMTRSMLQAAGNVPTVVVLEGGYNLKVIADCIEAVTLALLDEPYRHHNEKEESKSVTQEVSLEERKLVSSTLYCPEAWPQQMNNNPLIPKLQMNDEKRRTKEFVKSLVGSLVKREERLLALSKAQSIMKAYWSRKNYQVAKEFALKAINDSMEAILLAKIWKDCHDLQLFPIPIPQEKEESFADVKKRAYDDAIENGIYCPCKRMRYVTVLEQYRATDYRETELKVINHVKFSTPFHQKLATFI